MHTIKLSGGMVYRPKQGKLVRQDIAVDGTVIAQTPEGEAALNIDVSGCIVTSGLIDYHCHIFSSVPSGSVQADLACLPYGVTTAVDAGTSGAATYPIFHTLEVERARTRVLACLNLGSGGLTCPLTPEDLSPQHIEEENIRRLFREYPGELVALKLRNSLGIVEAGDEGPLRTMVRLGEELGVPVVVHMTNPAISCEAAASLLRPGDVFCHMYQGQGDTILDRDGKVKKEIWDAKKRGVLFDACNGNANFSFKVAKAALAQGFTPDLLGSDLTPMSFHRPYVYDLPRLMSKYLMLGLSLEQVLDLVTLAPARQLHREEELASLEGNSCADLAVFRLVEQPVMFQDQQGERYEGHQLILPQMTIRNGEILWAQTGFN